MLINDKFACFKILRLFIITSNYFSSKLIHHVTRCMSNVYINIYFTNHWWSFISDLQILLFTVRTYILTAAVFRQRHIYGYFLVLFFTNSRPYLYSQSYCSYSSAPKRKKNSSFS